MRHMRPLRSASASEAVSADTVVLSIGAEKITKAEFEQFRPVVSQMPAERRGAAQDPQAKRQLAEQLAELKALAQSPPAEDRPDSGSQSADGDARRPTDCRIAVSENLEGRKAFGRGPASLLRRPQERVGNRDGAPYSDSFKGSPVGLKDGEKDLTDEEALAKAKDLRAKIVAGGTSPRWPSRVRRRRFRRQRRRAGRVYTRPMVPPFDEAAFTLKVDEVS